MKRKILVNLGSGYTFKMVQIVCSLITVPILVSETGLGLSGYGKLAVVLSFIAIMSMLFDGFRLVSSKSIGKNNNLRFEETIRYLFYFIILSLPVVLIVGISAGMIIELIGLTDLPRSIIYIALIFFILEQLIYVSEQYFHSQLKTFIMHAVNGVEAFVRLGMIVLMFKFHKGTIVEYLCLFSSTYFVKLLFYLSVIKFENNKKCPYNSPFCGIIEFIKESVPLSFKGGSTYIVFRMSVIFANKNLSSEAAGVFSIIFVTLRGYLSQLFVTAMRPMVIPTITRVDMMKLPKAKLQEYQNLIVSYEAIILSIISILACLTPVWLPLWLGQSFAAYQSLIGVTLGLLGIEVAFSLKSLIMISQNLGHRMAKYSVGMCLFYLLCFYVFNTMKAIDLFSLSFLVTGYVFLYNGLSVNLIFSKAISEDKKALRIVFWSMGLLIINFLYFRQGISQTILLFKAIFCSLLIATVILGVRWQAIRNTFQNLVIAKA